MRAIVIAGLISLAAAIGCERSQPSQVVFEPEPRRIAAQGSENPAIHVEPSGSAFALVIEPETPKGRTMAVFRSRDGGDSFATRIAITRAPEAVDSQAEASPLLLGHHASTYYVLWLARRAGDPERTDLRLSRSVDYGQSFSEPETVALAKEGGLSYFNAAVAPNGDLVVIWFSYEGGEGALPGTASLNVASSSDGGKTFSKTVRAARNVCPCCRPAVTTDREGRWYLAWRGVDPEHVRDVMASMSSDRGQTWTQPVAVSSDRWQIHGCPHSAPSLAAFDGKLFVGWATGSGGHYAAYWASSPADRLQFTSRKAIAPKLADVNHVRLVRFGERLLAVVQARDGSERNGWGASRAYVTSIAPSAGDRFGVPPRSSGAASYPTATEAPPGNLWVAWTDSSDAGTSVWLARGRLP